MQLDVKMDKLAKSILKSNCKYVSNRAVLHTFQPCTYNMIQAEDCQHSFYYYWMYGRVEYAYCATPIESLPCVNKAIWQSEPFSGYLGPPFRTYSHHLAARNKVCKPLQKAHFGTPCNNCAMNGRICATYSVNRGVASPKKFGVLWGWKALKVPSTSL